MVSLNNENARESLFECTSVMVRTSKKILQHILILPLYPQTLPNDQGPQQLCNACWEKILKWKDLKQLAIESNRQILASLNLAVTVKEELPWKLDYLDGYSLAAVKKEEEESDEPADPQTDESSTESDNEKGPEKDLTFKCRHCSKEFSRKDNFMRHERLHSGDRPFQCKACDKTFKLKHHLNEHQLVHGKKMQFECDICNKVFPKESYLQTHKRLHTDMRPYKCEFCEKSFKIKKDCTRHKKIHIEEKSLSCPKCFSTFRLQHQLKRHLANCAIRDGKRFKCDYGQCKRVFANKRSLNKHSLLQNHKE